jgi:hypothetical protein
LRRPKCAAVKHVWFKFSWFSSQVFLKNFSLCDSSK